MSSQPCPPYPTYSELLEANRRAADELSALLRIPYEREGAWESPYVSALEPSCSPSSPSCGAVMTSERCARTHRRLRLVRLAWLDH